MLTALMTWRCCGTGRWAGCSITPNAPSTLGSFLREFRFGHLRQLDAVATRMLAGLAARTPVMVDIDDSIIEVHCHAKQGAGFGYTRVRGLNSAIATINTAQCAPVIAAQRQRTGSARPRSPPAAVRVHRRATRPAAVRCRGHRSPRAYVGVGLPVRFHAGREGGCSDSKACQKQASTSVIGGKGSRCADTLAANGRANRRYRSSTLMRRMLRSAVDLGLRFVDLTVSLGRIRGREEADEMQLVLDAPDVPLTVRRFLVERDAAAIQTLQSELFATPIPVHRISFAFPRPAGGNARAAEIFGVAPTFDAAENIIAFDPELLDAPLPQASEHTAALAAEQCRDLLARRQARTGLAGQVRDTLVARLADPPGADQVAARLNISGRTLRHRLAAEGTSFRALFDEAWEHMAEELLVNAGLTVAETAQRLGYVEVSSFSQAFRRWKGVGPRAHPAGHGE